MKIKNSLQYNIFRVFNVIILLTISAMTLYPMLHIIFASMSDSTALMRHTGILLTPIGFSVKSYMRVFENPMILKGYFNTFKILILGLSINMILTILGAYVLSKKELPGVNCMMIFVLITMFFTGGLIPTYLTVCGYGMYNTVWALVLPGAISTYNLIVMRTSLMAIPNELSEAATIDGANEVQILTRIILPLSLSIISVIVLFYAVSIWNAWFNAMIYLKDRDLYPLQLILREILIQGDTSSMTQAVGDFDRNTVSESIKYAVIIVSTLPIMLVYPFVQKNFIKGVMIGAVKG